MSRWVGFEVKFAFVIHQVEYSIPLGVAYCASALAERGVECRVFEVGLNPQTTIDEIIAYGPEMAGFSVYSGSHRKMIGLARDLKKQYNLICVFGGPHPTFFPGIIREDGVDAVCRGEGEEALTEFVDGYRKRGEMPSRVKNFLVKKGNEVMENPVRPLLRDLDSLPFPDRMLFVNRYPIYSRYGVKHFVAHRGCPYACTYCFNHAFNRLYGVSGRDCYRSRDPEKICEEIITEQDRMKIDMVSFVDDCFTLDSMWVLRFCEIYHRRVHLPFQINTRTENLDAERIEALALAGCWLIHLGVEAGDESYRKKVLKRGMTNQQIIRTVKAVQASGIRVLTENMIGLPTERYSQAVVTARLNMTLRPAYAAATFFVPYPELELTDYARRQGVYEPREEILPGDYIHTALMSFPTPLDRRRILNLRPFFNLAVHHPRLWPILDRLTLLPLTFLFRLAGDVIDGYYLWKLLPYRIGVKDFFRLVHRYLIAYRRVIGRERKTELPETSSGA